MKLLAQDLIINLTTPIQNLNASCTRFLISLNNILWLIFGLIIYLLLYKLVLKKRVSRWGFMGILFLFFFIWLIEYKSVPDYQPASKSIMILPPYLLLLFPFRCI